MLRKLLYSLAFIAALLTAFSFTSPGERYFEIAKNLDIFATLFKEVNAFYVDEVSPQKLVRTGIDAMLESLDPYTNYIPEDMVEDFRTINTGQYGGIGAVTRQIGNRTVVTNLMGGYTAEKNGLKIGDEILKIDQVDLSTVTPEQAGQLMKGQLGTPVTLTVKRVGSNAIETIEFKREKIKVNNVPYSGMLDNNIGYVQLADFTPDAGKEVRNAVVALKEQGAQAIVLDLRGNPGGLLMEAVNVCNIFIPRGKLVVTTKGKIAEQNQNYETLNNPVDTEIPVAVLINRGSASASEIVAGTLQDYDRAVVIGEKSFGKGLVQVSRQLSYNSQLKVTTAKYYTPTGRCIQVLDYSHRREDGSVGTVPDSLKQPFKTTRGRTVYDGGGIDPDVQVVALEAHPVTQTLFEKGYLFDYATQYSLKHPTIAQANQFNLSDAEYNQFMQWMKDKDYAYASYLDKHLEELETEAQRERYFNELKPQLENLKQRIVENRKQELALYKDQIKMLLEQDIATRYYGEAGNTQVTFRYDQDVKTASTVLLNQDRYKKLLNL